MSITEIISARTTNRVRAPFIKLTYPPIWELTSALSRLGQ
jgi:hypothetical protein